MTFDARGYYYRSRRVGQSVARDYLGSGLLAEIAALEDEEERAAKQEQCLRLRVEQARMSELDADLDRFCALVEGLAHVALVERGYRQHDRGAWRRRRRNGEEADG